MNKRRATKHRMPLVVYFVVTFHLIKYLIIWGKYIIHKSENTLFSLKYSKCTYIIFAIIHIDLKH